MSKVGRRRSVVWECFKDHPSPGKRRVLCRFCEHDTVANPTRMVRHIVKYCPQAGEEHKRICREYESLTVPARRRESVGSVGGGTSIGGSPARQSPVAARSATLVATASSGATSSGGVVAVGGVELTRATQQQPQSQRRRHSLGASVERGGLQAQLPVRVSFQAQLAQLQQNQQPTVNVLLNRFVDALGILIACIHLLLINVTLSLHVNATTDPKRPSRKPVRALRRLLAPYKPAGALTATVSSQSLHLQPQLWTHWWQREFVRSSCSLSSHKVTVQNHTSSSLYWRTTTSSRFSAIYDPNSKCRR